MSYCVNCGVELGNSVPKCPLCDTPVINPNIIHNEENAAPAFPENIQLPKSTRSRFSAIVASLLILLPNIICVITNLVFTPDVPWFIYVVSSSILVWFLFIFPFMLKKNVRYLTLIADTFATCAYIYIFYYYNSARTGWFWTLAVPLVIGAFAAVAFLTLFFTKKRTTTQSLISVFGVLTFLNLYVASVINLYSFSLVASYITTILGISCFILTVFFIFAEKNVKLKAWLTRKFFY